MTLPGPRDYSKFVINCWNGLVDDIQATLDAYPEAVRWQDPDTGGTGLYYAISHGSHKLNIAQMLLENGADIDAKNHAGQTALMSAAQTGAFACVEWLLDHGARMDLRNEEGQTAADVARARQQLRMAAFLEEYAQGIATERAEAEIAARKINAEMDSNVAHDGLKTKMQVKKPLRVKPRGLR